MSSSILTVSIYSYMLVVMTYSILIIIVYSCTFADIAGHSVIIV
jgi:hypothetical protein